MKVLEKVLDDKLKKLSVRILLPNSDGGYEHQGSGLLYLTENAYVLTAAHVLGEFGAEGNVVVECYPDDADSGGSYLDQYMFSVPMKAVWMYYEETVPKCSDANSFDEKDVAVIPLGEIRDWMKNRSRAYFLPEAENKNVNKGTGYGYPEYSDGQDIEPACSILNKGICCNLYKEEKHCFKWVCEEKLSYSERHGLSGSLVAMCNVRSVILMSVFQSTNPDHDGKVILGTDLYWIRRLLADHGVQIREADLTVEKQTRDYINRIETYLEKDYAESFACKARDMDLSEGTKARYKEILEKVLGLVLSDLNDGRLHGVDYGCADKQIAVRISPSASEDEIEQILNSYQKNHTEHRYPHMMLMAVTEDAKSAVIPDSPGQMCFAKRDIWDVPRLVEEIAGLAPDRIKNIFLYLDMQQTSDYGVKKPTHLLPSVPNPSDHFIRRSRDEDIVCLLQKLSEQDSKPELFISGIGGIGKTELAIQLALHYKPNNGAYFLRYVEPLRNADGTLKEEGMRRTILHAEIDGHTRGRCTDDEEYKFRMNLLRKEYKGALLIVDNFDGQGWKFGDLRNERSYKKLTETENNIKIVFTTRYDLGNAPGLRLKPINEGDLLELMRKNEAHHYATEDELKDLISFVKEHTLAVVLMAKTLKAGNGLITAAEVRKLLTNGPDPSIVFPEVESDQNGIYVSDTLFGHLQKLLTPAYLESEEKKVLSCLMLLPDEGMNLQLFVKSLPVDKRDTFNQLNKKGWVIRNHIEKRVSMDPLLRCICRHELDLDPELCKSFLMGLSKEAAAMLPDDKQRLELAKCCDNAVVLTGDSELKSNWKETADEIRKLDGTSGANQEQEVRI